VASNGKSAVPGGQAGRANRVEAEPYPAAESLPFLTGDLPGVGGQVKRRLEDFRVEEIPLPAFGVAGVPPASGAGKMPATPTPAGGQCLHVRLTKAGISTPVAITRLGRFLDIPLSAIGHAGMKDALAVTAQTISLENVDRRRLAAFHDSQMQLEVLGLGPRLRPGDLAGNRFDLRIRGVAPDAVNLAESVLAVIRRRGLPAYFGPQRFGSRQDNVELGLALLGGELQEFVKIYLGRARPGDQPEEKAARDAFDAGFLDRALQLWPRRCQQQRRVLMAYRQAHRRAGPAISAVDKTARRLYISSVQSRIFNQLLARRIDTLDRFLPGDIGLDQQGRLFPVHRPQEHQAAAEAFRASPTGPMVGYVAGLADAQAGIIERQAIDPYALDLAAFGRFGAKGTRRPLRFCLTDLRVGEGDDGFGRFLAVHFDAPPGCYATILLREIMKAEIAGE
jgi:tRNA pseudouridine13 synthase